VTTKRTRPLSADDLELAIVEDVEPSLDDDERHRRFTEGLARLRVGNVRSHLSERILLVLGGILAPLGVVGVLIGWYGASHTPYLFEQVPYLISGGLLGLSLVFIGCFMYFAHWLTELVKEQRAQSTAILAALERLQDEVAATNPATRSNGRRSLN
jgi:hypothetical protein